MNHGQLHSLPELPNFKLFAILTKRGGDFDANPMKSVYHLGLAEKTRKLRFTSNGCNWTLKLIVCLLDYREEASKHARSSACFVLFFWCFFLPEGTLFGLSCEANATRTALAKTARQGERFQANPTCSFHFLNLDDLEGVQSSELIVPSDPAKSKWNVTLRTSSASTQPSAPARRRYVGLWPSTSCESSR